MNDEFCRKGPGRKTRMTTYTNDESNVFWFLGFISVWFFERPSWQHLDDGLFHNTTRISSSSQFLSRTLFSTSFATRPLCLAAKDPMHSLQQFTNANNKQNSSKLWLTDSNWCTDIAFGLMYRNILASTYNLLEKKYTEVKM